MLERVSTERNGTFQLLSDCSLILSVIKYRCFFFRVRCHVVVLHVSACTFLLDFSAEVRRFAVLLGAVALYQSEFSHMDGRPKLISPVLHS